MSHLLDIDPIYPSNVFVKDILLKGSNLIKHIAAMGQHNPFSVYSNNCNELDDKYGVNFNLCTNKILNEWNTSINEMAQETSKSGSHDIMSV